MKVQIKDLNPNPFRDINHYPIDQSKVDSLINSIKETGFWDNILARKVNNKIEITYGHHRLAALQKVFGPEKTIDIPIHDLNDDTMLRIMAEENNDLYKTSIAVVDETIRQVKRYLEIGHPFKETSYGVSHKFIVFDGLPIPKKEGRISIPALQIAAWLGKNWPAGRIYQALLRIDDQENGSLDRGAVESLPSLQHGEQFRRAVKKHNLTKKQQKKVAKKIVEKGLSSVGRDIEIEVIAEAAGLEKATEKKNKDLADLISECRKLSETLLNKLKALEHYAEDVCGSIYSKMLDGISLKTNLRLIGYSNNKLFNEEEHHETKKLTA